MKNNNKNRSNKGVLLLLLLVLGISVGYAILTTTLKINGNTTIKKTSWDVHFANLTQPANVTKSTGATIVSGPTLTNDDDNDDDNADQTVTFSVTLDEPGDYAEFTVDVVNAGTIPAKIESENDILTVAGYEVVGGVKSSEAVSPSTWANYFKYTVKWVTNYGEDNEATSTIASGDTLAATGNSGSTRKIKVRVEYDKNVNNSQLPQNDVEFDITLTMPFVQDK